MIDRQAPGSFLITGHGHLSPDQQPTSRFVWRDLISSKDAWILGDEFLEQILARVWPLAEFD
jgi:hypothetical protein